MSNEQEATTLVRLLINLNDKVDALRADFEAFKNSGNEEEQYLTLKDLSKELGIGFVKAKELTERAVNPIPTVRMGKRRKVSKLQLKEWVKSNSNTIDVATMADTYCALNPR